MIQNNNNNSTITRFVSFLLLMMISHGWLFLRGGGAGFRWGGGGGGVVSAFQQQHIKHSSSIKQHHQQQQPILFRRSSQRTVFSSTKEQQQQQQQQQQSDASLSSSSSTTSKESTSTSSSSSTTGSSKVKQLDVKYTMDDIVSLCKRRGLIFPSSEIYNGYAGFFDYGPLGVELKRNIKDLWWKTFVLSREDIVGIDTSIIHNPSTWKSSGHVDGFSDPMVDCKETKMRFRADQLYYSTVQQEGGGQQQQQQQDGNVNDEILGYVCVQEGSDHDMIANAKKQAKDVLKKRNLNPKEIKIKPFQFIELTDIDEGTLQYIPSPASGTIGTLTMPRNFNLMFTTQVGAAVDDSSTAYLRPETAQGIFLNFKNCASTSRQKIPFGIAQIGKAFRNEITPRNFIFRSREFEQMEIEYFISPDPNAWPMLHQQWIADSYHFLNNIIGLRTELLGYDIHAGTKLAHYAQACTDITFTFPFGTQELMGIAARGNYDLTQHSIGSGKNLEYFDEQTKERYIPHCIEPSLGVDRLVLALICSAYSEDEVGGEKRSVLRFHPRIAPIKVAILPLVKNNADIVNTSRQLFDQLRRRGWNCQYDASGAIGRRYRRADEVGTPYCITIDFDTIEKPDESTVTIRDRDTTEQIRIPLNEVIPYLSKEIDGY